MRWTSGLELSLLCSLHSLKLLSSSGSLVVETLGRKLIGVVYLGFLVYFYSFQSL